VELAQARLNADAVGVRARVVVFVMVLVGLGFVLAPKSRPQPTPYRTLRGTTDQAIDIRIRLDERRRVRTFEARADMFCTGGSVTHSGWYPSDGGAPARFTSRGPRFEAVELRHEPSGVVLGGTLRGTIDSDGASGTLEMSRSVHGRQRCSSGLVSWTAR
jgi:hypothetical protein